MNISTAQPSPERDSFASLAGMAGLGFLIIVIAENALRGTPLPNNSDAAAIITFYTEKRTALMIAHGLFMLSLPCLLTYASGMFRRLSRAPEAESWARLGWGAVNVMAATFSMVVAFDLVCITLAPSLTDAPKVMVALFTIHSAAFIVNGEILGLIMLGFGLAARRSGTEPKWLAMIALIGSLLLIVGSIPALAVLEGSPWGLLGLGGFLCWLIWVGFTSVRMMKGKERRRE